MSISDALSAPETICIDGGSNSRELYRPLQLGETRLIRIHPAGEPQPAVDPDDGAGKGLITCSLAPVSLETEVAYNALSYVWGDPNDQRPIVVDGQEVQVTRNLEIALRHLRDDHWRLVGDAPIWIDALCINQADDAERAAQVRMMGDIFHGAQQVLCWLGEGDKDSDWALDRVVDPEFQASLAARRERPLPSTATADQARFVVAVTLNLEMRRYWTRVWVLQECILAKQDPLLLCGNRAVSWSPYAACRSKLPDFPANFGDRHGPLSEFAQWKAAGELVPLHPDHNGDIYGGSVPFKRTSSVNGQYQAAISLGAALSRATMLDASDPHDYVYATLAIVRRQEALKLTIDYSRSPTETFREAAAMLWGAGPEYSEDSLGYVQGMSFGRPEGAEARKHPSWVPKFAKQRPFAKQRSLLYFPFSCYSLSDGWGSWRLPLKEQIKTKLEGKSILRIGGVELDRVTELSGTFDTWEFGHTTVPRLDSERGEIHMEPFRTFEAMALRGQQIPIPESHHLYHFRDLRSAEGPWETLASWSKLDHEWLLGRPKTDEQHERLLWEAFMGRPHEFPSEWREKATAFLRRTSPTTDTNETLDTSDERLLKVMLYPLSAAVDARMRNRRGLLTKNGFVGVGSPNIKLGDAIVLIPGMKCPFVLRPLLNKEDAYEMVGFARVAGLMDFDVLSERFHRADWHLRSLSVY